MELRNTSIFIIIFLILSSLLSVIPCYTTKMRLTNTFLGYDISITFHEIIEKCKLNIIDSFIQYKISHANTIFEKLKIIEKYHNNFNKSAQLIEENIEYLIQGYKNDIISRNVFIIEMKFLNANINTYLSLINKLNLILEEMIKRNGEEILLSIKNLIENNKKIEDEFENLYKKIIEQIED